MTSRAPAAPGTPAPGSSEPGDRPAPLRAGAVLALAFTLVLAFLVVSVSYAIAREYGDTAADDAVVARRALRDWGVGIVLVAGLAALVVGLGRRSRARGGLTLTAVTALVVTLLGVPAVAVVGVHRKYEAYPAVPDCTDGFSGGPAVPVVRAAQEAFEEIEHPGPFSGGGESGIGGCASQLMVREDADVAGVYRAVLPAAGWRLRAVEPDLVEATRPGLRFTATRDRDGAWWVRVAPASAIR
jgi:hypothetical protein